MGIKAGDVSGVSLDLKGQAYLHGKQVDGKPGDGDPGAWLFLSPLMDDGTIIVCASVGNSVSLKQFSQTEIEAAMGGGLQWARGVTTNSIHLDDFQSSADGEKAGVTYVSMPDFWYTFDGEYHWIAATLAIDDPDSDQKNKVIETGVGVAKFSWDLSSREFRWVYDRVDDLNRVTTQDLWVVPRMVGGRMGYGGGLDGVAIGVNVAPVGGDLRTLRVILVDDDLEQVGLAGMWPYISADVGNGGSATYDSDRHAYRVLLPEQFNSCKDNTVFRFYFGSYYGLEWKLRSNPPMKRLLEGKVTAGIEEYSYLMPTEADLGGGYRALAVRRLALIDGGPNYSDDELALSICGSAPLGDDFSPILVFILDPEDNIIAEKKITDVNSTSSPQVGSRPHIVRIDESTLYVAYDGAYIDKAGEENYAVWIAKLGYQVPEQGFGGRSPPEGLGIELVDDGFGGRSPPEWLGSSGFSGRSPPEGLGLQRSIGTPEAPQQLSQQSIGLASVREPSELTAVGHPVESMVVRGTDDCFLCDQDQGISATTQAEFLVATRSSATTGMLSQATEGRSVDVFGRQVRTTPARIRDMSPVAFYLGSE